MTRAEVVVLLENQAKARARASHSQREPEKRAIPIQTDETVGGRTVAWSSREGLHLVEPAAQLTLVKPDALPPAVELVLPLPPSWNRVFKARAVPVGRGKFTAQVYKSQEAKQYAATVGAHVRRFLEEPFSRHVMLRVSGDVVMARAGCDLDDRFKVLLDSLQGHVFQNDEQVAEFGRVRRLVDSTNPHVRLTFEPIAVDRYGKATS